MFARVASSYLLQDRRNVTLNPTTIVQHQLDAYDAHGVDALMAIYADDVQHFEFPPTLVASGAAQVRERLNVRLQEPNLNARLVSRMVVGNLVIDQEVITRNFPGPEGVGTVELIAMYEVKGERIVRAWFRFGEKRLRQASPPHMIASEMPTTFWKATALWAVSL